MKRSRLLWLALPSVPLALTLLPLTGCKHTTTSAADAKPADTKAAGADEKPLLERASASVPEVETATVRTGTITKTLPVTGILTVPRNQQAAVSAPVAGVLDFLPVRLGQTVQRGETVAHLATRTLQGQTQQAEAAVAQSAVQVAQAEANYLQQQGQTGAAIAQADSGVSGARAGLAGAQATLLGTEAALAGAHQSLARAQSLFGEGLVAAKDVEAAQLAVRSAEAQVAAQKQTVAAQRQIISGLQQAAQAARASRIQDSVKRKDIEIARTQGQAARGALQTIRVQQGLYTLRAPISGTVTGVGAGVGESVDTTTKLVSIANTDRLQLQLAVPGASSSLVRVGQSVTFTVDSLPGKSFTSRLRNAGTQIDPANNTVGFLASVENRDHRLKEALSVRGAVLLERHVGAILVPRAAVLTTVAADSADSADSTEATVLRLDKSGIVHSITVKVGLRSGNDVEILSGLKAGDTVATTGAYGLGDGAQVTVAKPKPASDPAEKAP